MFSFIVKGFSNGALTPFLQNLGQMLGVLLCPEVMICHTNLNILADILDVRN